MGKLSDSRSSLLFSDLKNYHRRILAGLVAVSRPELVEAPIPDPEASLIELGLETAHASLRQAPEITDQLSSLAEDAGNDS